MYNWYLVGLSIHVMMPASEVRLALMGSDTLGLQWGGF